MPEHEQQTGHLSDSTKLLLETILDEVKGVNARLDLQNGRIRKLEAWRSGLVMAVPVITVVAYWVMKHVTGN